MKKHLLSSLVFLSLFFAKDLQSFPSSLYWTPCVTDVLGTGLLQVELDSYFTIFRKPGHSQFLPPDFGLTLGLFTWNDLKGEVGIDYLGGTDYPWFFNGKIGLLENTLFSNAPAFSIGMYNIGTKSGLTNFNIVDGVIGKTVSESLNAKIYAGFYAGNPALGRNRAGFMAGFIVGFCDAVDCEGISYKKWYLVGDYASGKSFVGGGGVGVIYNFTSAISLITGPTWFNDAHFNGTWKWTIQFTCIVPVFKPH